MARVSIGNKSGRVLQFLEGLGHPKTFAVMAQHGFNEAECERGWQLLKQFSRTRHRAAQGARAPGGHIAPPKLAAIHRGAIIQQLKRHKVLGH